MAGKLVKQNMAALAADGGSNGYAQVADSSLFPVGCIVFLRSNTVDAVECIVTDLKDSTHVGLRIMTPSHIGILPTPQYGVKSDLSAYLMADTATLSINPQVADEHSGFYLK